MIHASGSLMHSRRREAETGCRRTRHPHSTLRTADFSLQLWDFLGSSVALFEDSNALDLNVRIQGQCLYGHTPRHLSADDNLQTLILTYVLAGFVSPQYCVYISFIFAKSFMSAKKTLTSTTSSRLDPAASSTAPKFLMH